MKILRSFRYTFLGIFLFLLVLLDLFVLGILLDLYSREQRTLTEEEKILVVSIFGQAVNTDVVRIQFGGFFTHVYPAFTVGNLITFPVDTYDDEDRKDQALLLHEMTHVWQYQNAGIGYLTEALYEEIFTDAYVIHYDAKKSFFEYDVEEQGEIVAEYFLNQNLQYKKCIEELQSQPSE